VRARKWTSQDSVDTSASSSGCFEFLSTYAAQVTMAARWIVERINVVRYFGLRKLASSVDLPKRLARDRIEALVLYIL
jgi:hypothetical protein